LLRLCLRDGDTYYSAKAKAELLRALGVPELAPCTVISIKRGDFTIRTQGLALTFRRSSDLEGVHMYGPASLSASATSRSVLSADYSARVQVSARPFVRVREIIALDGSACARCQLV